MSGRYSVVIFVGFCFNTFLYTMHAMHDNATLSSGAGMQVGIGMQEAHQKVQQKAKHETRQEIQEQSTYSDQENKEGLLSEVSVDTADEWCVLENQRLLREQSGIPPLLCLEESDGWSLVGGRLPVFKLIDSVVAHIKETQKMAYEAQGAFNEQKNIISVLMRRTSPDYCQEVEESLKNNFAGIDVNHRAVYEYLGVSPDKGREMSHGQISASLAQLYDTGSITGKQYRQLCYPFKTAQSKEEYDAFLSNGLEQLRYSQAEQQVLLREFQQIIEYGPTLADVCRILMQVEEVRLSVPGEKNAA